MSKYLTPKERVHYQERLKELEGRSRMIAQSNIPAVRGRSTGDLDSEIGKLKRLVTKKTPGKVDDSEKNKLYAKYKRLKQDVQRGMPTKAEMWDTSDTTRFNDVVQRHIKWEKESSKKIQEMRRIASILDLADPALGNIELLRKK